MIVIRIGRVIAAFGKLAGVFLAQFITLNIHIRRAKREFKKTLRDMGLPEDAVSELTTKYPSLKGINMKFDPQEYIYKI